MPRSKWDFTVEEAKAFIQEIAKQGDDALVEEGMKIRDENALLLKNFLGSGPTYMTYLLIQLSQVDKELYLILSDCEYIGMEEPFDAKRYLRKMLDAHIAILSRITSYTEDEK